jgi:hypothetical protein
MNTIQVTHADGLTINYTELEVLNFIKKAEDANVTISETREANIRVVQDLGRIRNNVRDFFSEVEWEDGEQCVQKSDVNRLLESIGTQTLPTTFVGTATISFRFSVEAEDATEARSIIEDNTSVSAYCYDLEGDETTEVDEIDEA